MLMMLITLVLSACGGESESGNAQSGNAQSGSAADDRISDDQALEAIKAYCHESNPDLQRIEDEGEYPVYWEIESSSDEAIVVLFRSYTGCLVRYYIDPVSGDTYVTEFVEGITEEEQKTDEAFNVKDYI